MSATVDNRRGDSIHDLALHQTLERTSTKHGVQTAHGEHLLGSRRDLELHALLCQAGAHIFELNVDNLLNLFHAKGMEHHNVIDTVEELGAEGLGHRSVNLTAHLGLVLARKLGNRARAHVGRHNDDRVLEGHLAALAVGQATIIEHLQQDVEDIRVSLLHLVEQDHAVGTTTHSLGKLTALVVTHISRRSTDQTLDRELLHVFGHVDADKRALIIEQALGKRLGKLGFAHAGGAQEEEAADGLIGVGKARAAAAHGSGNGRHGLVLADNALMQLALEILELIELALHHLGNGHAGPCAYDLGNLVGRHLLVEALAVLALLLLKRRLGRLNLLSQNWDHTKAQLRGASKVAVARSALFLTLCIVKLALELLHVVDRVFLVEPARLLHVELFLDLRNLLAQSLQALLGGIVCLLHERLLFYLHLRELTRCGVDLHRHGVKLHAQAACSLVYQVDCLVGQEAIGNIAVGKISCSHQRTIGDMYAMEDLVLLLQATQDRDGVLNGGLAYQHRLETTRKSGIFLDVLAILVERGGADGMQGTAGKRRL